MSTSSLDSPLKRVELNSSVLECGLHLVTWLPDLVTEMPVWYFWGQVIKGITGFLLPSPSDHSFWEKCRTNNSFFKTVFGFAKENAQVAFWRDPQGREPMRPPAQSHVSEPSYTQVLRHQPSLQRTAAPTDISNATSWKALPWTKPQLSHSQITDPKKLCEIINVYHHFKPLTFGVMHYAVTTNTTGQLTTGR